MELKKISVNTASPELPRAKVLIIYTGGTFGMVKDKSGALVPFDFSLILEHLPTLRNLFLELTVISFATPIDSSNINPYHWKLLAGIIHENYVEQDGFVVLHGTDTMAYTSSALSFMLQGLNKPVIFTGAQLPIAEPRSDARENLITALEIASAKLDGKALVPEVCIFFGAQLIRGCRAKKVESRHFDAFHSENYPILAEAGVIIEYNLNAIRKADDKPLQLIRGFNNNVAILKLFPGITEPVINQILATPNLKGLVMETFGSGNSPTETWLVDALQSAIKNGLVIVNITQCPGGMVEHGKYETSKFLEQIGVLSGKDMTTEAAITKLMIGLAESSDIKKFILSSIAGERS